jgi:hypothetical protein
MTYYHDKWGGLMVKVFAFNPKVKGSNFMCGAMRGQQWYVNGMFFYRIPIIGV